VEQRSAFEWQTHVKTAAAADVEPQLFSAIAQGAPLTSFGDVLEEVRTTVRSVVRQQSVPQEVFDCPCRRLEWRARRGGGAGGDVSHVRRARRSVRLDDAGSRGTTLGSGAARVERIPIEL
jgi:hypothetical protein